MAGGARHLPLARPFQRHSDILADSEQIIASVCVNAGFALAMNEGDFDGHMAPFLCLQYLLCGGGIDGVKRNRQFLRIGEAPPTQTDGGFGLGR